MLSQTADLLKMFGHGFRAGADVQFFVDVPDVRMHRGVGDFQPLGDFAVKVSLGQAIENFLLAQRKFFIFMHRVGDLLE